MLVMMVATGARTEVTEIPPYVMVVGLEDPAPTSKYPPSPFPPSSLLLDEEERATPGNSGVAWGAEEEE